MVEETIDPCCGRIKLRKGCIIIGYFRLVVEIILSSFIVIVMMVSWSLEVPGGFDYAWACFGVTVPLMLLAVSIRASTLLLVGLHKNQRKYVVGFVKHERSCILFTVCFCVRVLGWPTPMEDLPLFLAGLILLLWQCFFLLVIQSYCESVGEQPKPATTAAVPAPAPINALHPNISSLLKTLL